MSLIKTRQPLVICEEDIEAALNHLRKLPFSKSYPLSWERKRFLERLSEAIGKNPVPERYYDVAPGVYAIIKPFGADLLRDDEKNSRLQVWILIRQSGTDPNRITALS